MMISFTANHGDQFFGEGMLDDGSRHLIGARYFTGAKKLGTRAFLRRRFRSMI